MPPRHHGVMAPPCHRGARARRLSAASPRAPAGEGVGAGLERADGGGARRARRDSGRPPPVARRAARGRGGAVPSAGLVRWLTRWFGWRRTSWAAPPPRSPRSRATATVRPAPPARTRHASSALRRRGRARVLCRVCSSLPEFARVFFCVRVFRRA